jgi:SAM-dependent methyltransferase
MILSFICPHDRYLLSETSSGLSCPLCGRQYPIQDGVVCTVDRRDEFYEGHYQSRTLFIPRSERSWHAWPLWLINSGYPWTVRHFVPSGAVVVELGCAGGLRYFGKRFRMVGCDLSLSSLRNADLYECRVQADAAVCIPLPDNSVDAVVSSYFWEHIPPDVKPHILSELNRILRPGGKLVFLYDVETKNPLIHHYKTKRPELYKQLFIAGDGHLGYQYPAENLATFNLGGFRIVEHRGMEKTWLLSPSANLKLAQFSTFGHRLLAWVARLGQKPFFYPYTALVRIIDSMICPWLPADWARVDMVVCEKN